MVNLSSEIYLAYYLFSFCNTTQLRALASYVATMMNITRYYLDRWEQQGIFTWYPELRNYILDIAWQFIVSISSGSQSHFGEWFEI